MRATWDDDQKPPEHTGGESACRSAKYRQSQPGLAFSRCGNQLKLLAPPKRRQPGRQRDQDAADRRADEQIHHHLGPAGTQRNRGQRYLNQDCVSEADWRQKQSQEKERDYSIDGMYFIPAGGAEIERDCDARSQRRDEWRKESGEAEAPPARPSAQASIPSGASMSRLNACISLAPSAPSMARWSKLPVALMMVAICRESSIT